MDPKSDKGIILGYFTNSKVYNKYTKTMMESINIVIDDTLEDEKEVEGEDDVSPQQSDIPADVPHKEYDIEFVSINTKNA